MKSQQTALVSTWDVLVVDADPGVVEMVRKQALATVGGGEVRVAQSVDAAQAQMKIKAADVLLVNLQINDNAGLTLLRSLREKYPRSEMIAMSRVKRSELCLDAWRAGAADMLLAPIQPADVERSLQGVAARQATMAKLAKRNVRLRSVCKQLNKARHEIGQQVDLLCNDLVRAYQEMAQQLNVTQQTGDFCQALGEEIEVEGLLRKTMEWLLQKVGPVNAAVYLPDQERRFALGAYLNLDTEADAALIQSIGDTVVKQADAAGNIVVIDDDRMLTELFGATAEGLRGRSWLSVGCFAKKECLAVIVVFRNHGQAIDASVRGMVEAIAPVLGEKIEEALGLYHRLNGFEYDDDESAAG